MNIVVVGLGYVGLANAIFLSRHHHVIGFDTDRIKIEKINQGICPIEDQSIREYFISNKILFKVVDNPQQAYKDADAIIVATPTDHDPINNQLDTSSVYDSIKQALENNRRLAIIIRSTLPIGTVDKLRRQFNHENIVFVPEFLREGLALSDTLAPTRLVIGTLGPLGETIGKLFQDESEKISPLIYTTSDEAEAIKLFSNAYLAMRVSFFNELDSLALYKHIDAKRIITALGFDPRIGKTYNNPSFGFSGYCLPKDTRQLSTDFGSVPHHLIEAINISNEARINFIVNDILAHNVNVIGIYRLTMKKESNNVRHAVIYDIIARLKSHGKAILIYEPILQPSDKFYRDSVATIDELINKSDLVIANRSDDEISKAGAKLYTRDAFRTDK